MPGIFMLSSPSPPRALVECVGIKLKTARLLNNIRSVSYPVKKRKKKKKSRKKKPRPSFCMWAFRTPIAGRDLLGLYRAFFRLENKMGASKNLFKIHEFFPPIAASGIFLCRREDFDQIHNKSLSFSLFLYWNNDNKRNEVEEICSFS